MAKVLEGLDYVEEVLPCETNILIFKLTNKYTNKSFLDKLAENGILAFGFGPQLIRFVTHYDFTDDHLTKTIEVLKKL